MTPLQIKTAVIILLNNQADILDALARLQGRPMQDGVQDPNTSPDRSTRAIMTRMYAKELREG